MMEAPVEYAYGFNTPLSFADTLAFEEGHRAEEEYNGDWKRKLSLA